MDEEVRKNLGKVVESLINDPFGEWFLVEVNPVEYPDYPKVIKNPMWLKKVRSPFFRGKFFENRPVIAGYEMVWGQKDRRKQG